MRVQYGEFNVVGGGICIYHCALTIWILSYAFWPKNLNSCQYIYCIQSWVRFTKERRHVSSALHLDRLLKHLAPDRFRRNRKITMNGASLSLRLTPYCNVRRKKNAQSSLWELQNLNVGQTGCPETSLTKYSSTLHKISEEPRCNLNRDRSLKRRTVIYIAFL